MNIYSYDIEATISVKKEEGYSGKSDAMSFGNGALKESVWPVMGLYSETRQE